MSNQINELNKFREESRKFAELAELNTGDKVKLTDGSIAEFVRLKQKKFIGNINGTSYDIPVGMFVEVVEKVDKEAILKEINTLKPNEPFYINQNGKALLFLFEKIQNDRIIGVNPISKGKTRIDKELYAGKVGNL